jgi:hypothetical protein
MSNFTPSTAQASMILNELERLGLTNISEWHETSISITTAGLWTCRITYFDGSFKIASGHMSSNELSQGISKQVAKMDQVQGPFKKQQTYRAVGSFGDTQEKARRAVEAYRQSVKEDIQDELQGDTFETRET